MQRQIPRTISKVRAEENSGRDGATGATGQTGATGAAGAAGVKGDTGAAGAAGAKGDTGAKGAKGDTGAAGQSITLTNNGKNCGIITAIQLDDTTLKFTGTKDSFSVSISLPRR